MEDIFKTAVSQAPGLVVLVVIVIYFLRTMEKRDALIKNLTDEHLAERRLTRDALDRTYDAMERNALATVANTNALNNTTRAVNDSCKFKPQHS